MINILTFAIIRDIAFYLFHPVIAAHECYYMYWGNNLKIKYYDHPFITGLLSSYTQKNNIYIKRLPYLILTILTNILVHLIYVDCFLAPQAYAFPVYVLRSDYGRGLSKRT